MFPARFFFREFFHVEIAFEVLNRCVSLREARDGHHARVYCGHSSFFIVFLSLPRSRLTLST